jgi:ribosome-associated protein
METTMIHITDTTVLDDRELVERFVRSTGARSQNARKEATAVELRFDIGKSSLPPDVKERLIRLAGRAVTRDRVLTVVSRADRSQAKNRDSARARLLTLLRRASTPPTPRTPTAVSPAERQSRLTVKHRQSALKRARSSKRAD